MPERRERNRQSRSIDSPAMQGADKGLAGPVESRPGCQDVAPCRARYFVIGHIFKDTKLDVGNRTDG